MLSGYGLSEVGSVYTANLPWAKRIGAEGRPIHGADSLRVAPVPGEDGEAQDEGVGEIQLKGPSMLAGYDDREATAAAFTRTAGSGPETWAASTRRATSGSPAGSRR